MNSNPGALLIPEMGLESKAHIELNAVSKILGKSTECDIQIDNPFISRKHCHIDFKESQYILTDLDSKNGTFLNGERLGKNDAQILKDGDILDLAVEAVRFRLLISSDHTIDQSPILKSGSQEIRVDPGPREVWIRGDKLDPPLAPKEFEVLALLFSRRGNVVSQNEIAESVWPERAESGVGNEEIMQCIRRIRRRIEKDPSKPNLIKTRKGSGYIHE